MIAYIVTAIEKDGLKDMNAEFKEEVYADHPHNKLQIDNCLQFMSAVMAYFFYMAVIKARYNFRNRTMLLLMSNIIASVSVFSIKSFHISSGPMVRPVAFPLRVYRRYFC